MSQHRQLLITVHGIRTFGLWQERLEQLVRERVEDDGIDVVKIDYGYFSIIAFFLPFTRWLATRRIRRLLAASLLEQPWGRIDVVAHSFGTHLVAHGLRGLEQAKRQQFRVHTLILAGSVLKPWFAWEDLIDGDDACVGRVVNECGTRDLILVSSHFGVLLTGMAGRVGFRGRVGTRLRNRYFSFGHSGYFVTAGEPNDFMERWWLPLILGDEEPEAHDARSTKGGYPQLNWALDYAEPVKMAAYAGLMWLLLQPVLSWYEDARVAGFATRVDTLLTQSADRAAQRDDEGAAILALAAFHLDQARGTGRRAAAEAALRAALSAEPFAHALEGTEFEANSAAMSSDGALVAAGSPDGLVRVWDLGTSIEPWTFEPPSGFGVSALALEPGGTALAVGDVLGSVVVVDLADRRDLSALPGCEGGIESLAWHPQGLVVAGTEERTLCVWDLSLQAGPPRVIELDGVVRAVAISLDGTLLAAGEGEAVRLWDRFGTAQEGSTSLPFEEERVRALEFGIEPTRLAIATMTTTSSMLVEPLVPGGASRISILALDAEGESTALYVDTTVRSLALAPGGKLAAGGSDGSIRVWESGEAAESLVILGHSGPVVAVAFDRTGDRLFSAAAGDPAARMWKFSSSVGAARSFTGPPNPPLALDFCGVGHQTIALAYPFASQVYLWDYQAATTRMLPERDGVMRSVACDPNNPVILATGRGVTFDTNDTQIRLWDLSRPVEEQSVLPGHIGSVLEVTYAGSTDVLVSIGEVDHALKIWEPSSGRSFEVPPDALPGAPIRVATSVAADPARLAVATDAGSIAVWEVGEDGTRFLTLVAPLTPGFEDTAVGDVALSSDGELLAVAAADGSVVVWDLGRAGEPLLVLNEGLGDRRAVNRVAFSPDGATLAGGRADGSVATWSLAHPRDPASEVQGPDESVYALRFSPDGDDLAAGFADGTVMVWRSLPALVRDGCGVVSGALGRPAWSGLADETDLCR